MKQKNNWCCWITTKTFKLFREKKLYENVWERNDIFYYWEDIGFDINKLCKKCEKLFKKEWSRFEADARKEEKRLEKSINKCDNCGKSIKPNDRKEKVWIQWCSRHGKSDCCVVLSNKFCGPKCLKKVEDEDKQHWLKQLTIKDLNQEIRKRKLNAANVVKLKN